MGRMSGLIAKFSNSELDLNRDPPAEESVPQEEAQVVDDDVVESSAVDFEQAKLNASSRRVRRRGVVSEDETKEDLPNPSVVILESSGPSAGENASKLPERPKEQPVFSCPICMQAMVEETSTRCGHIFCKACIKTAVSTQPKCPTCRKRVAKNQLIRVFLPAAN